MIILLDVEEIDKSCDVVAIVPRPCFFRPSQPHTQLQLMAGYSGILFRFSLTPISRIDLLLLIKVQIENNGKILIKKDIYVKNIRFFWRIAKNSCFYSNEGFQEKRRFRREALAT